MPQYNLRTTIERQYPSTQNRRLTTIEGIGWHGRVRIAERQRVNRMRHVELGRQGRVELMDVSTVTHNALAVRDVEVARYFVDAHFATHGAALVRADVGEVLGAVVYALCGVAQNLRDAPLLQLVGLDQLVAGVAAAQLGGVRTEAVAAVVRRVVFHFHGALSDNLHTSGTNWDAMTGDPLLHHFVFYVQLVIACHIHRIQMYLSNDENVVS